MKRILTLMVMTLLIAAMPQSTFSKVKKTKTTKTTKTPKSASRNSSSLTVQSTRATTVTQPNNENITDYQNYSNSAPEIDLYESTEIYKYLTTNEECWSSYTPYDRSNLICDGKNAYYFEATYWGNCIPLFDSPIITMEITTKDKRICDFFNKLEDKDVDAGSVSFSFSDGHTLEFMVDIYGKGKISLSSMKDMMFKMASTSLIGDDSNTFAIFFHMSEGNLISDDYDQLYRPLHHYLSRSNITKITLKSFNDNTVTIPIDMTKWGSQHTFKALFDVIDNKQYVLLEEQDKFSSSSNTSSTGGSSATTTIPSNSSSSSSSTSTYSTPSTSTYSTPSYNYSYKLEPKKRFWGFSAGYVQKQWQSKEGGSKEKMGFWEDSKVVHGVQAGFRATPYFKFGLGLNTGLLYEYYYTKSQPMVVDGYDVYGEMQEHALYMPVHLTYRLKFNDFHIYAFGGVGLDYGIMSKVQLKENGSDYVGYDNSPLYETEDAPDWKRFNASYEFGGGLRYKMVELQFTMSRGFLNMSHDSSYKLYQNKPIMFSLGFMF